MARHALLRAGTVGALFILAGGCATASPATLPASGALALRWGDYADTSLDPAQFYGGDHTLMLRFMAQYERAYEGPLVANTGAGSYLVEMGDYHDGGDRANLYIAIGGAEGRFLIPQPVPYPADSSDYLGTTQAPAPPVAAWRHLAVVKSGATLAVYLDGQRLCPAAISPQGDPCGQMRDAIAALRRQVAALESERAQAPAHEKAALTHQILQVYAQIRRLQQQLTACTAGCALALPGPAPSGVLRLGKRPIGGAQQRETQFYGFIDDVALFNRALMPDEIAAISAAPTLNGDEPGLVAGYLFQQVTADTPAPLQQQATLQGYAYINAVSETRDNVADTAHLPLPTQQTTLHLPFKIGEVWQVLQGFNSYGSHGSYAAFSWDFIFVPQDAPRGRPIGPSTATEGREFVAAGAGTVAEVHAVVPTGPPEPTHLVIEQAAGEYGGYLHFLQNSTTVFTGTTVAAGTILAKASNVGGGGPHLHFAVSNYPESRRNLLVTFPIAFSNYMASDDYGLTWTAVPVGMPRVGQWIKRDTD